MNQRNRESFRNIVKFIESACLLLCFTGVFAYIWQNHLNEMMLREFENKGNLLMIGVYFVLLCLLLNTLGGFKIGTYRKASVALSQGIALVGTNAISFVILLLMIGDMHRIGKIIKILFVMTCVQVIISLVLIIIETAVFRKLYPPKRMLVLYETRKASHIIEKIQTREDKYTVSGTLEVGEDWKENLEKRSNEYEAVLLYDISSVYRNDVLKYCYANGIRTYVIPKISDIIIRTADELQLFDTPILVSGNDGMTVEQAFLKRAMDIIISLVGIIITSPIMLAAAIAIKAYDKGPALYKQARCTIDNRVFYIYKFRSMIVDAEKDGVARLAAEGDSRITPVGNFIRKTRIDELPQFFNVLKGDMSIVGPRPERPEIIKEYCEEFPEFSYRTKVKAGLTGYAQVYGKYNTTSYDKLKWDLMYIQKFSIGLDIKLIIMTIKIVFMKESTEGLSEGKRTANSMEDED